ncbi:MAG TPA: thiol peroxidase [Candidatus Brocadiales bacterium]|nr:thiol peroxidase [Candidatus Brocadiales bacterium]
MKRKIHLISMIFGLVVFSGCANFHAYSHVEPKFTIASSSVNTGSGNSITMKGAPVTLEGESIKIGDNAPEVTLAGTDLKPVALPGDKGRVKIISIVPSLDTKVCENQTHLFSERNNGLDKDVDIITISMDLPFAQARFSERAEIKNLRFLSDHKTADFGRRYGLLIKELRLLSRSVIVLDKENVIRYIQVVPELTQLPDFERALAIAKSLL